MNAYARALKLILSGFASVRFAALAAACLSMLVSIVADGATVLLPGAGAPIQRGESYPTPTYSWFAFPAQGGRGFVIGHIPPRSADENVPHAAADGVFRSAIRVEELPEAMAAWGEAVYVVFAPNREAGESSGRSVYTLRAKRFADSDLWVDEPSGRMETLPGLTGSGRLLGFAAIETGPTALWSENANKLRLSILDREWVEIELPEELTGVRQPVEATLAADAAGLCVLQRKGDEWIMWRGLPQIERNGKETKAVCAWERSVIRASGVEKIGAKARIFLVGGRWYVAEENGNSQARVSEVSNAGVRTVATVEQEALSRAIVPMDGLARLIVISIGEGEPASGNGGSGGSGVGVGRAGLANVTTKVTEISLLSGRVLYSGPAKSVHPLGSGQFRLLAVGLILSMALILVLVIRSDDTTEPHLPEGYSLAEPMRRAIAGVLDFAIVSLLVPRLTGNSVLELLGPAAWLDGEAYQTLILIAGLGAVIGTAGEYFFGRSPGKLLTDCEVISLVPQPARADGELPRPELWACLVRNGIKWFLSPVAVLAMMDATGRHRGDQIARAAVVIRIDPNEEEDPFGDE